MPMYILRNIDEQLWSDFKASSKRDGIPMRALILKLVELYNLGKINISARKAPAVSQAEKPPPTTAG